MSGVPGPFDTFKYIYFLPDVAWESILYLLDGGSLLAFAEAVPSLEHIILQARFFRALKFAPDTEECTIRHFPAASISDYVQKLDFNNCTVLSSETLLRCVSSCINLKELCCVNVFVEHTLLFALLATNLTAVRSLELSVHGQWFEKSTLVPNSQLLNENLESMYVELTSEAMDVLTLMSILCQCRHLRNLHVHFRKNGCGSDIHQMCAALIDCVPSLNTFKCTCESPLHIGRMMWLPICEEPLHVPAEYRWFGNLNGQLKPLPSFNFVIFKEEFHSVQLAGVKQAVVALESDTLMAHRRIFEAASMPERWSEVSSLCLVLLEPSRGKKFNALTASRRDIEATQLFLKNCVSSVTELNLAWFHFDRETDASSIVGSTLPQLRALALAPCAVNHADSLKSLARGCKYLEQLDIRAERECNARPVCESCQVPVQFSEACFKELHESTKLWQLSLDDTARLTSLDFLRECRVTELRFSLASLAPETTRGAGFDLSLSLKLRTNPRLSSLAINTTEDIQLRKDRFATGLAAISTLRHLCVLTGALSTKENALSFFQFMQAELPVLQVLHAHYIDEEWVRALTWLRQRHCVPTSLENGEMRRLGNGVVLFNRPCIGCYRRCYIGLTRPRNLA